MRGMTVFKMHLHSSVLASSILNLIISPGIWWVFGVLMGYHYDSIDSIWHSFGIGESFERGYTSAFFVQGFGNRSMKHTSLFQVLIWHYLLLDKLTNAPPPARSLSATDWHLAGPTAFQIPKGGGWSGLELMELLCNPLSGVSTIYKSPFTGGVLIFCVLFIL